MFKDKIFIQNPQNPQNFIYFYKDTADFVFIIS